MYFASVSAEIGGLLLSGFDTGIIMKYKDCLGQVGLFCLEIFGRYCIQTVGSWEPLKQILCGSLGLLVTRGLPCCTDLNFPEA